MPPPALEPSFTPSPQFAANDASGGASFFKDFLAVADPVAPALLPQDFGRFAAILRDDDGFPRTYGDWLSRTSHTALGRRVRVVEIGFDEFVAYCRHRCSPPRLAMLVALASDKAAR